MTAPEPQMVRALTESGDYYEGAYAAWGRYAAAANRGDWAEVQAMEEGRDADFRYAPPSPHTKHSQKGMGDGA